MTLLSVVKDVCATVGVALPQSVFSNITGNRTMQEMLSLANEMAQRIAYDYRDWTKLRAMATFTGDGIATDFALPANYKRMLLNSNVWRSGMTQTPLRFILNTDDWMQRRAADYSDSSGEWTMLGGRMHISPEVPIGETVYFSYLDKNCIDLASGGRGDVFMSDLDSFTLDERVLKLGMIAQWKAQKGSPYAEDMGTFGDALANVMGRDSPAPIIIGRTPISANTKVAIPTQTLYFPGAVP
jgi:hypothetical protein